MPRDYNYDILPEIKTRYAVKNFSEEKLAREELLPLIEAARYAPSAFNEQPWRFILGDDEATHGKIADTLAAGNAWAKKAPVLLLILTKTPFAYNGKPNAHSRFDAGCASGFLQLEAARRGLVSHCMSGFDANKARELLSVPEEYDIIAVLALGKPANLDALPEELRKLEEPGTRNPLDSFIL
ncbi:nitroreductase family protein [Oscillospiraceae bacterium OttesenSCG-928-G22]|nr:nitroreductase family protein [Oscillospiraceae bacterium OttesenSCG-928-G22]